MLKRDPKTGLNCLESVLEINPKAFTYKALRDGYTGALYAKKLAAVASKFLQLEKEGRVRLVKVWDDDMSFHDWAGEMFDPDATGMCQQWCDHEKRKALKQVQNDGFYGVVAQYLPKGGEPTDWEDLDSCFGFHGSDFDGAYPASEFMGSCVDRAAVADDAEHYAGFENEEALCSC